MLERVGLQPARVGVGKAIRLLDGGCSLGCMRYVGMRAHGSFTWQAMILMRDALMPPDP